MTSTPRRRLGPVIGRRTFVAGSLSALGLGLAGCGSNGGDEDDLAELRIMLPLFETAPDPEGALATALADLAGKRLDVTWVPATDYPDRMTVTMASDDLPEIMVVMKKDPIFVQSAQAGAFWDLTDKLADHPNLAPSDEQVAKSASVNGTQYGIFRRRDPMRATAVFRADWLASLGLETPQTIQELRTVAEAFVTERPGGAENTGLLLSQWGSVYGGDSPYEYLEVWHGAPNGWGEREGKLVPAFDTEEFMEAQRFLRSMREDGLLNADFATLTTTDLDNGFFTGKGGIAIGTDDAVTAYTDLFEESDPGNGASYIANAGNLIGPDGQRHAFPTPGYNGFLAFSKQSVTTEGELDDILAALNELNTTEGQYLQSIGIEGESFTLDGEFYEMLDGPEAETITNDAKCFNQLMVACNEYHVPALRPATPVAQELLAQRDELRVRDLETAVYNAAAGLVSEAELAQGATLNQIIGDARVKFIAGEIDEAGYREEITRWHSSGGDDVIAEINDLAGA